MQLTVKYIGNDQYYWKILREKFKDFPALSFVFLREPLDENFHPPTSFISTHNENCDIVYVDLSHHSLQGLSLCKLLCRNNVTRAKSLVVLDEKRQGGENLLKAALAGVRLSYYKGIELDDVVFHPLSLLNTNLAPAEKYAEGVSLGRFTYNQILRIGYIADDHFRVETNSPLEPDKVIEIENHPLQEVMKSKRLFVQDFSDCDLYYNQRFSYNLKFTYVDDEFFKASEGSWIAYKKDKEVLESEEAAKKTGHRFILQDMEKRRKALLPVRNGVKEWLGRNQAERARRG